MDGTTLAVVGFFAGYVVGMGCAVCALALCHAAADGDRHHEPTEPTETPEYGPGWAERIDYEQMLRTQGLN